MTEENLKTDREQLEQAISALENQRDILGDAVVDAALSSIREKLSTLIESQKATQQRKLATVLFMDIVGSTYMSQDLDPEDTMTIMNTALRRLAVPVYANGGRVANYMGDGFLALFGAPVAHEEHALRACHAALAIQKSVEPYAEKIKNDCGVDFKMRIGLNSGPVVVGSIGVGAHPDAAVVAA